MQARTFASASSGLFAIIFVTKQKFGQTDMLNAITREIKSIHRKNDFPILVRHRGKSGEFPLARLCRRHQIGHLQINPPPIPRTHKIDFLSLHSPNRDLITATPHLGKYNILQRLIDILASAVANHGTAQPEIRHVEFLVHGQDALPYQIFPLDPC